MQLETQKFMPVISLTSVIAVAIALIAWGNKITSTQTDLQGQLNRIEAVEARESIAATTRFETFAKNSDDKVMRLDSRVTALEASASNIEKSLVQIKSDITFVRYQLEVREPIRQAPTTLYNNQQGNQ